MVVRNALAIAHARRYRDASGVGARPGRRMNFPRRAAGRMDRGRIEDDRAMKVKNSLRSLKSRHRDCRIVRRKGRVYVINKTQRRFKARQG